MTDKDTIPIGDSGRPDTRLGDKIGPYLLVEHLGEGGMGQVYLAQQREPIRRDVAIKLIRRGLDSDQVIARFEAERQSLALMEHPNIAKILDAGSTDDGRPFFVMEYVPGGSITRYCDDGRLTTEDRLRLFLELCDAVQHAHQKGIIHRDLKPSNVLVEIVSERPTAKIIDFGVSKATAQQLTEKTLFTQFGQLVGTPEYMSPEQAEHSDARVDTRTDIYSLGVLLYELLVGMLPFDPKTLRAAGLAEIHRILREDEPPRPSARLSTQAGDGSETAARRRTSTRLLMNSLRGDLDWVVMKAMDKDRARRYASASEFAADVRRYLNHEPVLAGAPTLSYRARKFARRNRAAVTAAAVVVVTMVGATAVSSWQAIRATRAEREAQRQTALALTTRDYLVSVFQYANPALNPLGRETSIQEALDRAVDELGDRFESDPELNASLRSTIGGAYHAMGDYATSAAQAEATLEDLRSVDAEWSAIGFQARHILASTLDEHGRDAEAANLLNQCIERPEFAGLDAPIRAGIVRGLAGVQADLGHYGEADSLFGASIRTLTESGGDSGELFDARLLRARHLRAMSRFADADREMSTLLDELEDVEANLYRRSILLSELSALRRREDRIDESRGYAEESLAAKERILGPDHPSIALTLTTLAGIEAAALDFEKALSHSDRATTILTAALGVEHPSTLTAKSFRAEVIAVRDGNAAALALYEELLEARIRIQGDGHPDVVLARTNVGTLLSQLGHYDEAGNAFRASIAAAEGSLRPNHLYVFAARMGLANVSRHQGDFAEARLQYEAVLVDAAADPNIGRHHPNILQVLNNLGLLLTTLGDYDAAERLFREYLLVDGVRFPNGNLDQADVWNNLGVSAQARDDLDAAVEAYTTALELGRRFLGDKSPTLAVQRNNLASIERARGNYVVAEVLFADALELFRMKYGDRHPNVSAGLHNHGFTLIFLERYDDAEREIQAAIDGLDGLIPPTHLYNLIFKGSLGYCRAFQGRFEEAEDDLLWSYENLVDQLGSDHKRSRKVAGYLAETYEKWGHDEQVAEWKAKG